MKGIGDCSMSLYAIYLGGNDMKKRLVLIFVILLMLFSVVSCDSYELRGIEKYNWANSSMGISSRLLPDREFHNEFEYVDSEYYYTYSGMVKNFKESELMYLRYEKNVYEQAKQKALDSIKISDEYKYSYKGREFYLNLNGYDLPELSMDNSQFEFPYWFNMMSFDDKSNSLIFIGFYAGPVDNLSEKDREILCSEVGLNIQTFFDEYFIWTENLSSPEMETGDTSSSPKG